MSPGGARSKSSDLQILAPGSYIGGASMYENCFKKDVAEIDLGQIAGRHATS